MTKIKLNNVLKRYFVKYISFESMSWLRLSLGLYFNCSSSKRVCFLAKCYCVLFTSIVVTILTLNSSMWTESMNLGHVSVIIFTSEHLFTVLWSLVTEERYQATFYAKMKTISLAIGVKPFKGDVYIALIFITMLLLNCFTTLTTTALDIVTWSPRRCAITVLINASVLSKFPRLIIFRVFWGQMEHLRKKVQTSLVTTALTEDRKIYVLFKCRCVYKNLLDSMRDAVSYTKFHTFTSLISTYFKAIFIITNGLLQGDTSIRSLTSATTLLDATSIVVLFCILGLFAEAAIREWMELKATIAFIGIHNDSDHLRRVVSQTLEYMDARPPRYSICRILPIDASLSVGFINSCVTYIIAIKQLY